MADYAPEFTLAHALNVTKETSFWCLVGMCGILLVDVLYASRFKARYFVCHTIINALITLLVLQDSWWLLSDPLGALEHKSCSNVPLGLVFAIHFYHMIGAFVPKKYGGFKLYYVDWLHHILMVVLGCPAIMFAAMGPTVNFNFLFVCGIPGGLDYFMLVRVKEGLMKPLEEKRINTLVNFTFSWIVGRLLLFLFSIDQVSTC